MKKIFIIHPYLFAIFPIISLYNHNKDIAKFSHIFYPIAISFLSTIVLYFLLKILAKNKVKAAVLSSSLVIQFFVFGYFIHIIPCLSVVNFKLPITTHHLIIVIWIDFVILTFILVLKTKRNLISINGYLNTAAIFLFFFPVINILTKQYNNLEVPERYKVNHSNLQNKVEYLPDIYYIVFDGYARADILKEIYGYDNNYFIDYLTNSGFFVADQSKANYSQTYLSMASSLNLKLLNSLSGIVGEESSDRSLLSKMISKNYVYELLKNKGYLFVSVPGCWTGRGLYADIHLHNDKKSLSDFEIALINITPLSVFLGKYIHLNSRRESLLFSWDNIPNITEIDSPTFMYAHFLIPHPPFIFTKDGKSINPKGLPVEWDGSHYFKIYPSKTEYREKYKNQLAYVNKKVKKMIDEILDRSNKPPIIILQSDHGPGSLTYWENPEKTNMKERFSILNAYYLPEEGKKFLYESITPVNTFRVLFNYLFDTNFEMLDDESYFSTWSHPYKFINVTNELSDN